MTPGIVEPIRENNDFEEAKSQEYHEKCDSYAAEDIEEIEK